MKTKILSFVAFAFIITACNNKKEVPPENQTTAPTEATDTIASATSSENTTKFACSMHPEITGTSTDKCSKCGMTLTVAAAD